MTPLLLFFTILAVGGALLSMAAVIKSVRIDREFNRAAEAERAAADRRYREAMSALRERRTPTSSTEEA